MNRRHFGKLILLTSLANNLKSTNKIPKNWILVERLEKHRRHSVCDYREEYIIKDYDLKRHDNDIVPMMFNHDWEKPIGKCKLHFIDDKGLYMEILTCNININGLYPSLCYEVPIMEILNIGICNNKNIDLGIKKIRLDK